MSDKKDEFYVGYLPKAPKGFSRFAKGVIALLFVLSGITAYLLVSGQKTVSNGTYEFGELTEVEGLVYKTPQPFIRVNAGNDIHGHPIQKNILLINFGKFGASETLRKIESKMGVPFDQAKVKLRGTLIYHNGVTLMELTELEDSFVSFAPIGQQELFTKTRIPTGIKTLHGEIVDSKCYFGSMKPGQGKAHRACAGLCISGGIPPVFVAGKDELAEYYLLLDTDGNPIQEEVLPYLADPLEVIGRTEKLDEWNLLYIDTKEIKRLD